MRKEQVFGPEKQSKKQYPDHQTDQWVIFQQGDKINDIHNAGMLTAVEENL